METIFVPTGGGYTSWRRQAPAVLIQPPEGVGLDYAIYAKICVIFYLGSVVSASRLQSCSRA